MCLSVLGLVSVAASAQEPAAPPMPKNPNQLLMLAQKENRLTNPDIQPWHLKISVKQFDPSGSVTAESQIEGFWAGASRYKVVYTTPSGSTTQYGSERGMVQPAGMPMPPIPVMQAGDAFTNPILENENVIGEWVLKREERKQDGVKLVCLIAKGIKTAAGEYAFRGPTYCLDAAQPSLLSRSFSGPAGDAIYTRTDIQNFHGYYVPRDVELTVGGKRKFEARLELIEDLAQTDEAFFAPPADAVPTPLVKSVAVSAGIASAMRIGGEPPEYPIGARMRGMSGTVVLEAKIGKDGSISDLKVVSGPEELQKAALAAVRTWRYRPYLLNGEPVEVRTQVNVVFQLR